MARLASETNEGSSVDGNGSLGEVFRRKRVEKVRSHSAAARNAMKAVRLTFGKPSIQQSRLLQPTVKTINFDQHPAENSYRYLLSKLHVATSLHAFT